MTEVSSPVVSDDFLIRAEQYLKDHPDFKLVGRKKEIEAISDVLMRSTANNLVLYGQNGVGISSILHGMQAAKSDVDTPFDIASKKFFYLDTDALFSSGNTEKIIEGFKRALDTLATSPDTVLILDDIKDFMDGVKNNGVSNIFNMLMRALKTNPEFQVVIEAREDSLAELFKSHSDMREIFTFQEVREPSKEDLRAIVENSSARLEKVHGVKISTAAIDMVMELTAKYPGLTLNTSQPRRSELILEGALTTYRRKAHAHPQELVTLEETLATVTAALEKGVPAKGDLADKTQAELEALRIETEETLKHAQAGWVKLQAQIRAVYQDQMSGEEQIRDIDREIAAQRAKDEEKAKWRESLRAAADEDAKKKIKDEYHKKTGGELVDESPKNAFNSSLKAGNFASGPVADLQERREKLQNLVDDNKATYQELTEGLNAALSLTDAHVLAEFSRLSHLPVNKLKQDESEKLMNLAETLKQRVFGQDEPVEALAKAVKRGRTGLKKPKKPIGSFIFMGPSGVGKTELAKALAEALFGDESALSVYAMSEYMEKHASATLIGAPPGYEGYEQGGVLTNAMRQKPYSVNIFDEIEKADKQVFDLFLQIVDEGTLTDRRGIPASFANSINILTSNIGAQHFLNTDLTFEEAKKKALADLWNPEVGGFRPEFLNRFTGIFCFDRLGQAQILMIANKSLKELNSWVADQGISIVIPEEDKKKMCEEQYDPKNGARGIMTYIENTITSDVAEVLLKHPDEPGTVTVKYEGNADKNKAKVHSTFNRRGAATAPVNENKPAAPKPPAMQQTV